MTPNAMELVLLWFLIDVNMILLHAHSTSDSKGLTLLTLNLLVEKFIFLEKRLNN